MVAKPTKGFSEKWMAHAKAGILVMECCVCHTTQGCAWTSRKKSKDIVKSEIRGTGTIVGAEPESLGIQVASTFRLYSLHDQLQGRPILPLPVSPT